MCKDVFINPFTDFGFKRLFGNKDNKRFLISFLNSLLTDEVVTDINYQNVEKLGIISGDRNAIFDLYCTTAKGDHIIVEMQNAYQRYIVDRSIFYSSFAVQEAAQKGNWNFRLPRIYTIAFLNFTMLEYCDSPEFKHVIRLCDTATGQQFSQTLTYIYLEMPKFIKDIDEIEKDGNDSFDQWMYAFKNLSSLDEYPERLRQQILKDFFEAAKIEAFPRTERIAYEMSLKQKLDYDNTLNTAKEMAEEAGRAEGLAEGRTKGRAEGLAEGRAEGLAEGRAEGRAEGAKMAKLEVARGMLRQGIPLDTICSLTGLDKSDITAG